MTNIFTCRRNIANCPWIKQSHREKCSNKKLRTELWLMTEPSEISALGNINNVKISDLLAFVVILLFPLFVLTWKFLVVEESTSRKLQDYENIYGGDSFTITLKNQWHFYFYLPLRKTKLEQLLSYEVTLARKCEKTVSEQVK